MSDTILIRGFTASDPALSTLPNGVPVVNFRLASTPRWQDATGTWKEGTTNWYTVKAYRRLAQNIATSIEKGQPLVVSGRQRISRRDRGGGRSDEANDSPAREGTPGLICLTHD